MLTAQASATQHRLRLGGKAIEYTATAGTLIVRDDDDKPIASAYTIFGDLKGELKTHTDRLLIVLKTDLPAFNAEAKRLGLEPIVINKQPVVF